MAIAIMNRRGSTKKYELPEVSISATPDSLWRRSSAQSVTFTASITKEGVPAEYTYQWYWDGEAVAGETGSTYTRSITQNSAAVFSVYCVVTNTAGNAISNVISYQVKEYLPTYTYSGTKAMTDQGNGNWKLTIKSSGTLKFTDFGEKGGNIDIFCVGAGGGGGEYYGGGGGGYTTTAKNKSISLNTNYTMTIGGGNTGRGGGTTAFSGVSGVSTTANGGYSGGGTSSNTGDGGGTGCNGGSGGGGAGRATSNGGNGGSNGGNGGRTSYGRGIGQGTTTREFGESSGTLYSGGGGGQVDQNQTGGPWNPGNGGNGGGGAGGKNRSDRTPHPSSGTANTGGGGGGGKLSNGNAASGGSGIIVIRNKR